MADGILNHRRKNHPLLVQLLESIETLDAEHLERLWQSVGQQDSTIEETMIRCGVVSELQIARAYSDHYLIPLFDPPPDTPPPIDPAVASLLSATFCREHLLAPLNDDGSVLEIAIHSPDSLLLADDIRQMTGRQMRPLFASQSVIEAMMIELYGATAPRIPFVVSQGSATDTGDTDASVQTVQSRAPSGEPASSVAVCKQPTGETTRYLHRLLQRALSSKATEILITPTAKELRVQFRVDGVFHDFDAAVDRDEFIAHLKRLSKMDVQRSDQPQNGSLSIRNGDQRIEMTVHCCPTMRGEAITIRRVDRWDAPLDLSQLGMDSRQQHDVGESIHGPRGLVLVSGPAESGKRTTLYACLNALKGHGGNLFAIESVVKSPLTEVHQVHSPIERGFDTGATLRAVLEQSPDAVMVDELRDRETAIACVRATFTAPSILSSLRAASACDSLAWFQHWGIAPFELASSLRVSIAQRLVRRLCNECMTPYHLDIDASERYGIPRDVPIYRAGGCGRCGDTGYKGRTAVFEVLRITPSLRTLIRSDTSIDAIERAAVEEGMTLLWDNAIAKVIAGQTSLEEAIRCCSH